MCLQESTSTYLHPYDNAVVSRSEAGTVLKAKVSGLKTELLTQLCFFLLCEGKDHTSEKSKVEAILLFSYFLIYCFQLTTLIFAPQIKKTGKEFKEYDVFPPKSYQMLSHFPPGQISSVE